MLVCCVRVYGLRFAAWAGQRPPGKRRITIDLGIFWSISCQPVRDTGSTREWGSRLLWYVIRVNIRVYELVARKHVRHQPPSSQGPCSQGSRELASAKDSDVKHCLKHPPSLIITDSHLCCIVPLSHTNPLGFVIFETRRAILELTDHGE